MIRYLPFQNFDDFLFYQELKSKTIFPVGSEATLAQKGNF